MAGDWIKMRADLAEDPAVIGIAAALALDEDSVLGKLLRLWSWADRQTTDGNASGVTPAWIDRYLRAEGFARALESVGWLVITGGGISIPNWERHHSKSAKERALTARRVSRCKQGKKRPGNGDTVTDALPVALPREEKRRDTPPTPSKEGEDGRFAAFWAAYPKNRKVKKAVAQKAWKKLKPDQALFDRVMAGLEAHKRSDEWARDGGQYVPHPTTWLNHRRWEDEVAAEVQPGEPEPARRTTDPAKIAEWKENRARQQQRAAQEGGAG